VSYNATSNLVRFEIFLSFLKNALAYYNAVGIQIQDTLVEVYFQEPITDNDGIQWRFYWILLNNFR
jgi:hypothetical protein